MPSRSRIHSPLHLSARAEILTGMRMGLPILIGYVPLGIAYGVLAVKNGVPAMWAVAMSVLVFAGAWQAEWEIIAVLFTKLSFVFSCDFPIFDGFSQNPLHETVSCSNIKLETRW